MKTLFYSLLGYLLLADNALAASIRDFEKEVFKPKNAPTFVDRQMGAEAKINFVVNFLIDLIIYASGALAVFFLVVGAIHYIVSFGQQDQMDKAKKTIQYALLGLLAVIFAYFVIANVTQILYESAG